MGALRKALLGRTVTKVVVAEDRGGMTLETTTGPVRLVAYGDCCSVSWIESLDDEAAMLGTIREVEEIEMPDLGSVATSYCKHPDSVAYYGLKIVTEHGRCVIDYRNDSNGYYGGSLEVESA